MSKKVNVETVEVTLKIPRVIIDFLKAMETDVHEYLVDSIIGIVAADIDSECFYEPSKIVEKYGLGSLFKEYDVFRAFE